MPGSEGAPETPTGGDGRPETPPAPPAPPTPPSLPPPGPGTAPTGPVLPGGGTAPGARPGGTGKRSAEDPLARWELWWEHNKGRFLARRPATVASGGRIPARPLTVETARDEALRPLLLRLGVDAECGCRAAAIRGIGFVGTEEELPLLLRSLSDPCPEVRGTTALSLAQVWGEKAVPYVLPLLRDPKERSLARAFAAVALGLAGGDRARGGLEAAIADGEADLEVRGAAVFALGFLPDDDAVADLEALLAGARAATPLRALAAGALGRQGRLESVPALVRALRNDAADVRRSAALALGAIPWESERSRTLRAAIERQTEWSREGSLSPEARRRLEETIEELREEMRAEVRRIERLRAGASLALARVVDSDPDAQSRGFAVVALGEIGGPDALRALGEILGRSSHPLRSWACVAAGVAGEDGLAPALRRHLVRTEGGASVRSAAAIGLGLLRDRASVPALSSLLESGEEDPDLRGHAALALAMISDSGVPAMLQRTVHADAPAGLVRQGALALGIAGGADAALRLLGILRNARRLDVRSSAVLGLRYLRAADPLLDLARECAAPGTSFPERILATVGGAEIGGATPEHSTDRLAWHLNYRIDLASLSRLVRLL